MRPTEYPFVVNGPPCLCDHARDRHVGPDPVYEIVTFDEACNDCEGCQHYRPAGDVDYEAMRKAEEPEHMRIVGENMRRRTRVNRYGSFLLLGTLLTIPLAFFKPELWPMVAGITFGVLASALAVREVIAWREGNLGQAEAAVGGIITASVAGIALAVFIQSLALGAVCAVAGMVALVFQHHVVISQYRVAVEKMQRLAADYPEEMEGMRVWPDPDWHPDGRSRESES